MKIFIKATKRTNERLLDLKAVQITELQNYLTKNKFKEGALFAELVKKPLSERNINNRIKYTLIDRDGDACTYTSERSEIEIMQYTGQHDRNGKEIYEGDLVIIPVEDEQEAVKIEWDNDSSRFVFSASTYTCDFDSYGGGDCEVVGNIYDNFEQDESVTE